MTVATMSKIPTNFSSSRKHGGAGHGDSGLFDPQLARLVLQMCLRKHAQRPSSVPRNYVPRMDLYDDETLPRISAMLELPGVPRDKMSVIVREGKLVVTGERSSPLASRLRSAARDTRTAEMQNNDPNSEMNPAKYRFRELKCGRFHREIDIPLGIQTVDVVAEMSDGMLLLSWPRNPVPQGAAANWEASASA